MSLAMELSINPLTADHLDLLKNMFYLSLYVPEGEPPFPRSIIEKPHLARYHSGWGRESDYGLVAMVRAAPIGATWRRFFSQNDKGYGFVNDAMPEIGIALHPGHRGQGIGTILLQELLTALKQRNIPGASLSVDTRNRAVGLYEKLGFVPHRVEGYAMVMYRDLTG